MIDVHPMIARLKPYEAGKPLDALERELGITNAIKLASNENAWGPAPAVFEAVARAMRDAHIYPDAGNYRLREALSRRLDVPPGRLVFGNGSNELLSLIVRTFGRPDDTVLSSAGSFIAYRIVAMAHGHTFAEAPLGADSGYDLDALLAAVDATTRVIFIANPNNPTGTYLEHAAVERFIEAVHARRDGNEPPFIVLDEAYLEYVDAPDPVRALELVAAWPRVIATRTFSKAYALAALRLGYAVCGEEEAGLLNRVREPFNINGMAEAAALAALADEGHLRTSVAACLAERARVAEAFPSLGLLPVPSQANFLFARVAPAFAQKVDADGGGKDAAARLYDLLLREGIITRPMGPAGFSDALRITIGLPAENDRLLATLARLQG